MKTKQGFYKHPKYGHVYGDLIVTPVGRFSWPSLTEPKAPPPPIDGQPAGQARYEVTLLIDKDSPRIEKFMRVVEAMSAGMLAAFNSGRKAKISDLTYLADGDEKDVEKYPFYEGKYILIARNVKIPRVVNCDKPEPSAIERSSVLGGMKGRLLVTPMVTAHGLSYKLEVVQFVEDDGVRFGGGLSTKDAIGLLSALEDDEEIPDELSSSREADDDGDDLKEEEEEEEVDEEEESSTRKKRGRPSTKGKQACVNLL